MDAVSDPFSEMIVTPLLDALACGIDKSRCLLADASRTWYMGGHTLACDLTLASNSETRSAFLVMLEYGTACSSKIDLLISSLPMGWK